MIIIKTAKRGKSHQKKYFEKPILINIVIIIFNRFDILIVHILAEQEMTLSILKLPLVLFLQNRKKH